MASKISIHQPNYLPWAGYFSKILQGDIFVLLDQVQYSKNSVINRNVIKTPQGSFFLSIPIEKKFYHEKIKDVLLPQENKWAIKHWKSIETNYSRAPFFNSYKDFFSKHFSSSPKKLVDFNEKMIRYLIKELKIEVEIRRSSELKVPDVKASDLLLSIVEVLGGSTYISGPGGREYLHEPAFNERNVKVEYTNYPNPSYPQLFGDFLPRLSVIDLLFNVGEKARKYL